MKRFTLKVPEALHQQIKNLGKQQEVVLNAIQSYRENLNPSLKEYNKNSKAMTKQIAFQLSGEIEKNLISIAAKPDSRHLLKLIRQIIYWYMERKNVGIFFFNGFDNDLKSILIQRFRDLWTHESTAIEGNSFTLGETSFVLKEGLTISGKTVREHDEITGHAKAIEIIYSLINKIDLDEEDIFSLHKSVIINPPFDVDKPVGAWKRIENGALWADQYILYPSPRAIPKLMQKWLNQFNSFNTPKSNLEAIKQFCEIHNTFAAIHPFFDGNGRIARLIANIPVLKAGFPPIIISNKQRMEYMKLMKDIKLQNDQQIELKGPLKEYENFVYDQWKYSLEIIEEVRTIQKKRDNN